MMVNYKERKTISGEEGVEEFLASKESWNAYVDKHNDNTEVDFSDVDFSEYRKGNGEFNFSGYRFPKKGDVKFMRAKFGNDAVDFSWASFGEGNVSFDSIEFKKTVNFSHSQFGKRTVSFYGTIFGIVYFDYAKFGIGDVYFLKAEFKDVLFFRSAEFGEGGVYFSEAKFGGGSVYFTGTQFGQGRLSFTEVEFEKAGLLFDYCEFKGDVSFRLLKGLDKLEELSFRHSSFDKSLDISDNTFNCIPDLTNTKLTNQVSLDRMEISDNYPLNGDFDKSDGERLCRLKELAEANRSYQKALDLHVIEMRAKRDIRMRDKQDKIKNQNTKRKKLRIYLGEILHRYLDKFFDVVCIYGQSIIRPVLWLLGLTIVCALIYANESSLDYFPLRYGFLYSLSQVFSFVPAGRIITIGILDKLFPCEPQQIPDVIYSLSLIQGVLSFLFLFLIGLGFRNRFRL